MQYYLISNTKGSGNFAEHIFDYQVSSFEDDFEVGLSIKYRVSCDPGKEVKVAEALWNNNHPAAELERRVKKYIDDFFAYASDNEITDLVNNYSKIIKSLQKRIVVQVKQEIGLNIQLKISLDGEDDLRSVRFSSSHFPVQFRDYSERQQPLLHRHEELKNSDEEEDDQYPDQRVLKHLYEFLKARPAKGL